MKKRLLNVLLIAVILLTLLPMTAFAEGEGGTSLGTAQTACIKCKKTTTFDMLEFIRSPIMAHDRVYHWVRAKCTECGNEQNFHPDGAIGEHSGGTETPTCTTGKTCEKCGEEYGILGHDWSEWQSSGDGKTHIRHCQREGCDAVDTANCGGDGNATCVTMGTCTVCGQQYYGGHSFPERWKWGSDPAVERDAESHWLRCSKCNEGKAHKSNHVFGPGNMYLKSEATCSSKAVYYKNCTSCYYKGTDTYVYQWGQLDPKNHDGGTEVKDAKPATCTEKGYTGDTYCKGCGVKLSEGTDIPAAGHDWAAATCTTPKTCKVCKATEGNALGHKLTHVAAKRATSFVAGNIEYWYCTVCGKYYRDAAAAQEITKEATVTHKESAPIQDRKTVESSKTGDPGVMLYAGMAVLSLTGCAWLRRKEK